jgi:hypothetical protein
MMKKLFSLLSRFFHCLAAFFEGMATPANLVPDRVGERKFRMAILLSKPDLSEEEKKELAKIASELGEVVILEEPFRGLADPKR